MTLQQLEYIVAVDTHRHFVKAAASCFVTQATLSMMIKKLEEELGVIIFNRSKHPIEPTPIGKKLILQAKATLQESSRIVSLVADEKEVLTGTLRIGIIPTLAPYLLPLFLDNFLQKYPNVKVQIKEITTDEIARKLLEDDLDVGLLAIPLQHEQLEEQFLFKEDFVVYAGNNEAIQQKTFILAEDIDINRLWLLEEGHCLRSQVVNLCELTNRSQHIHQLDFAAGSIETLKKIVQSQQGLTILPFLALQDLSVEQKQFVKYFQAPAPYREIGLVTHKYQVKERLIAALNKEIRVSVEELKLEV